MFSIQILSPDLFLRKCCLGKIAITYWDPNNCTDSRALHPLNLLPSFCFPLAAVLLVFGDEKVKVELACAVFILSKKTDGLFQTPIFSKILPGTFPFKGFDMMTGVIAARD